MTCKNNLKQIGLGLHNYADTYNEHLPPGLIANYHDGQVSVTGDVAEAVGSVGWSWGSMILPFIDQAPAYNRMDFDLSIGETERGSTEQRERNNEAVGMWFSMATCPNDERNQFSALEEMNGSPKFVVPEGVATTSYYGSAGSFEEVVTHPEVMVGDGRPPIYNGGWSSPLMSNGVFATNSSVKLGDIVDGTSVTIGAGEVSGLRDPMSATHSRWYGAIGPDGSLTEDVALSFLRSGQWQLNAPTNVSPVAAERGFSSEHKGGSQFLFMDGTVQFISENIELVPKTSRSKALSGCNWRPVDLEAEKLPENACGEGVYGVDSPAARAHMDLNYGLYQRLFSRNDSLEIGEY